VPLTKRVTLRLTPEGFRRLEAIAATRGVDPSRALRQLVDEADVDARPNPVAISPKRSCSACSERDRTTRPVHGGQAIACDRPRSPSSRRSPQLGGADPAPEAAVGARR
jgi:hypothetical protein